MTTAAGARAQKEGGTLAGVWQTHVAGLPIVLKLNADGTGEFDDEPMKYTVRDNRFLVVDDGKATTYTFSLRGDTLVVSGGDLGGSLTFTRMAAQPSAKDVGGQGQDVARAEEPSARAAENPLVGRWQSRNAAVEIRDDGTLTLDGAEFSYVVKGNFITLTGAGGSMSFQFELSGDTLRVLVGGETVVYRRGGDRRESSGVGGADNSQELVGKWCYMANVNSHAGGRTSNRCFTLYADGTYEYYAETSASGPVASSASQESDSGRWTATATTITAQSPTTGTHTYPLEKRNHPKTGDPMLVLDGDAYVTATQRAPWPE